MQSHRVLLSLRPDKLQIAQQVDAGVELKLDREDADLVIGDRDLAAFLDEHDMPQEQLVSVHPPPGTRGRQTDTTVTQDNVGNVIRFNDTQLQAVTPEFVVLHTDRRIDVRDHLFTLQEMAASLDVRLVVENPPGKSYWATPEDHAFFAYTATTADTPWYLTVDTHHLDDDLPTGFVDEDDLDGMMERATENELSPMPCNGSANTSPNGLPSRPSPTPTRCETTRGYRRSAHSCSPAARCSPCISTIPMMTASRS